MGLITVDKKSGVVGKGRGRPRKSSEPAKRVTKVTKKRVGRPKSSVVTVKTKVAKKEDKKKGKIVRINEANSRKISNGRRKSSFVACHMLPSGGAEEAIKSGPSAVSSKKGDCNHNRLSSDRKEGAESKKNGRKKQGKRTFKQTNDKVIISRSQTKQIGCGKSVKNKKKVVSRVVGKGNVHTAASKTTKKRNTCDVTGGMSSAAADDSPRTSQSIGCGGKVKLQQRRNNCNVTAGGKTNKSSTNCSAARSKNRMSAASKAKVSVGQRLGKRVASLNASAVVHALYESDTIRNSSSSSDSETSKTTSSSAYSTTESIPTKRKRSTKANLGRKRKSSSISVTPSTDAESCQTITDSRFVKRVANLNAKAIMAASHNPPKKKAKKIKDLLAIECTSPTPPPPPPPDKNNNNKQTMLFLDQSSSELDDEDDEICILGESGTGHLQVTMKKEGGSLYHSPPPPYHTINPNNGQSVGDRTRFINDGRATDFNNCLVQQNIGNLNPNQHERIGGGSSYETSATAQTLIGHQYNNQFHANGQSYVPQQQQHSSVAFPTNFYQAAGPLLQTVPDHYSLIHKPVAFHSHQYSELQHQIDSTNHNRSFLNLAPPPLHSIQSCITDKCPTVHVPGSPPFNQIQEVASMPPRLQSLSSTQQPTITLDKPDAYSYPPPPLLRQPQYNPFQGSYQTRVLADFSQSSQPIQSYPALNISADAYVPLNRPITHNRDKFGYGQTSVYRDILKSEFGDVQRQKTTPGQFLKNENQSKHATTLRKEDRIRRQQTKKIIGSDVAIGSEKKKTATAKSSECKNKKRVQKTKKIQQNELCLTLPRLLPDEIVCKKSAKQKKLCEGWKWNGDAKKKLVHLNNEDGPVLRTCYPAMVHVEGDIVRERDSILVCSGSRKTDIPYVAKISALWESPDDDEMMMSVLWYYRPEQTEHGRKSHHIDLEVFASKHRDSNSVACIEDRCYVLTYAEFCRYQGELRRQHQGFEKKIEVVPSPKGGYHRSQRLPSSQVSSDRVFVCRRVYDYRQKRCLKNPV